MRDRILVAEFHKPQKVYTFPFIVGSIIPKSVKCIHSATKLTLNLICQASGTALEFRIRLFRVWDLRFRITLRLLRGSWAFWGRVWAFGAKVWDLTTRVHEH